MRADRKGVLYWLGAGASAEAIPVVADFTRSLHGFSEFLKKEFAGDLGTPSGRLTALGNAKNLLVNQLDIVVREAEAHLTIDTLARKYSITKDIQSLAMLKRVLSTYFFFKETISQELVSPDANGTPKKYVYETLDKRYDALVASILNETSQRIPKNIRFLSWNYDGQLELALERYVGTDSARSDDFFFRAQMVKMNGGYLRNSKRDIFQVIVGEGATRGNRVARFFQELDSNCGADPQKYGIRFAWEELFFADELEHEVWELFQSTESSQQNELILCGYSFPYYNRVLDQYALEQANKRFDRIVLQYPEGHHQSIVERITEIFPRLLDRKSFPFFTKGHSDNFKFLTDTRTFFIPFNAV